ncbi:MAG: metallophosphoesterase [Clostridia bacterium]|nr:metallophosphoesterase [Clostridia bacterium]
MNRRPSKSRKEYDAFNPDQIRSFDPHGPSADFFKDKPRLLPYQLVLRGCFLLILITVLINLVINQFVYIHRATIPITGLTEAFDGYTILHISDLKGERYGTAQDAIRSRLAKEHFDLVVMTGDMISERGNAQPFYELIEVLRDLNSAAPIYFIPGDTDPAPTSMDYASGGSPFAPWILGARQRGATYLSSPQMIESEEQRMWVMSLSNVTFDTLQQRSRYEQRLIDARRNGDKNEIELAEFELATINDTENARAALQENDIFIVLTHVPNTEIQTISTIPYSKSYQIDLILSGHFLGGLVRIPIIGPVFVPSLMLPRYGLFPGSALYAKGERQVQKTWYSVSTGLGKSDRNYPFFFLRLNNPPTISLLTLSATKL